MPILDPNDPSRYAALLSDEQRGLLEQWAFNFWTMSGRKFEIPQALFDLVKSQGVDTKHMAPIVPTLF